MPKQETQSGYHLKVYPSFVEQMAKYYYDQTDAKAVSWDQMMPIRRELLIKAMGEVLDKMDEWLLPDKETANG